MFTTHCGINTQISAAFFLLPNTSSTFEKAIIISENLISTSWDVEESAERCSDHTGKAPLPKTESQQGLQERGQLYSEETISSWHCQSYGLATP